MNQIKRTLKPEEIETYLTTGVARSSVPAFSDGTFKGLTTLTLKTISEQFQADQSGALLSLFSKEPDFIDYGTDNELLDLVESLIGPDICLVGSSLFLKRAGSPKYASWHSDVGQQFEKFEKMHVLSVTVAVTASTKESGCVRYLPFSHEKFFRNYTEKNYENSLFGSRSFLMEESEIDFSKGIIDMELAPGECSFNNLNTVHSSEPNKSTHDRILVNFKYLASAPDNGTTAAQWFFKKSVKNRILVRGLDKGNFCNL